MTKYKVQYRATIACEIDIEVPQEIPDEWYDEEEYANDLAIEEAWQTTLKLPNLIEFWGFEVDEVEKIENEQNKT